MNLEQSYINESFKFVAILENAGEQIFHQVGLTVKTYGILYLISTGLNTSKGLLSGTYGSKPNMTKKLNFLDDNGFILRITDEHDKRIFRCTLTPKALGALEEVSPIYDAAISEIFQNVSQEDLKTSLSLLEKCITQLQN